MKTILAMIMLLTVPSVAAPVIAVLEERVAGGWNRPLAHDIRLGFVKTADGWAALDCDHSQHMLCAGKPQNWVIYRGTSLGTVTSGSRLTQGAFGNALAVTSHQVPRVGAEGMDYAGWMETPTHRPLVALSQAVPAYSNPWTPADDGDLTQLWPLFRRTIPKIGVCRQGQESEFVMRPVQRQDLRARPGWTSSNGASLLVAQVDPGLQHYCDGADVEQLWFYRDPQGAVHLLPGQRRENFGWTELKLVDAGDMAGDGEDLALFFFSGYNHDGYILVYDHFRRAAEIGWHYH